jgi:microsomal dipeptidase-like Zn-dependent dipeptidase
VQFASQTGFNAMADSDISVQQGGQKPDHFHGLSEQGRAVAAEMNRLGILIDVTTARKTRRSS